MRGRRAAHLSVADLGTGPPVVLLHGLTGSGLYWGARFDALGARHRVVVPDLLGFGWSPRPAVGYGPDDHAAAVEQCLLDLHVDDPVVIGAHSLGVLIALRVAVRRRIAVAGVVGFGPPVYASRGAAKAHVSASGPMSRLLVLPGGLAQTACRWVCSHRKIAAGLAILTHPGLPAPIAADSVQHSWESYSETLDRVVLAADAASWFDDLDVPVLLVTGHRDPVVDHALLDDLARKHIGVRHERWDGGHHLPLTDAERCVGVIEQVATRPAAG